jgi:hypothetical protein
VLVKLSVLPARVFVETAVQFAESKSVDV